MELSIYDQEMDMSSSYDWALFGGQLLTAPNTPAEWSADLGGHVLQDWTGEPAGQLVSGQSPVEELLLDSIWSDTVEALSREHISASRFQKASPSNQKRSFSRVSSSDEAFLLYEGHGKVHESLASTFDDGSYLIAPLSDAHSLSPSPIGVISEDDTIDVLEYYLIEPPPVTTGDQNYLKLDKSAQNLCISTASHLYDTLPFHSLFDLNSIPQEVPYSFSSDLDQFDDETDSLRDPESVCKILEQLGEGSNSIDLELLTLEPVLSPMSPEEVESVLSYDSVKLPKALSPSQANTQYSASDRDLASLSLEYLQRGLALKVDSSSSSRSSVVGEPYCTRPKADRTQKKKEQNKTAAHRYRIKKREEKGVVLTEVEELEQKNNQLKARAEDLTREINYLRALLDEIKQQ